MALWCESIDSRVLGVGQRAEVVVVKHPLQVDVLVEVRPMYVFAVDNEVSQLQLCCMTEPSHRGEVIMGSLSPLGHRKELMPVQPNASNVKLIHDSPP